MNNTVTFKVAGNEVISFMDQLKRKADDTTSNMISNAKQQSSVAKDQIRDLEKQIALLEKKNRLESAGSRLMAGSQRDDKISAAQSQMQAAIKGFNDDFASGKLTRFERNKKIGNAEAAFEETSSVAKEEYKDQLRLLREEERQSQMQTKLLRENAEAIRETSSKQLVEMKRNNSELVDELNDEDKIKDPAWRLANEDAKQKFKEEKESPLGARGFVGGLLGVENIKSLIGIGSQFASTQNGFDLIKPAAAGAGNILGTVAGGLLGLFGGPAGAKLGAGIGGSIGSMFGGAVGEFEQRRGMASQDFLKSKYGLEATTGQNAGPVKDMSAMGVDVAEYLSTLRQIAVNTGSSALAAENTNDVLTMGKGLGIGQDVSSQMITYFRGTNKDISNLVTGIMAKGKGGLFQGGDTTFLNEFLQKFNQLHTELRGTTEKVSTGTTFDILNTFNKMGGQFSARDPRSSGLISTIQGSLANPGSDSTSALSFLALRKANPNMGIADLLAERQKGLASPTYLKSMLDYVESMGGDEQSKIMNTAGVFGLGGNLSAAKRLYQNRGKVGAMSSSDIEDMFKGDFGTQAESKTTAIDKNMAEIKNGLLGTWIDSVDAMADAFTTAMRSMFQSSTITMQNGTITLGSGQANLKTNTTQSNKKEPAGGIKGIGGVVGAPKSKTNFGKTF